MLRRTTTDTTSQQVIYEDRLRTVAGVPAWLLTVTAGLALAVATVTVTAVRRRPVTPPRPATHPDARAAV